MLLSNVTSTFFFVYVDFKVQEGTQLYFNVANFKNQE